MYASLENTVAHELGHVLLGKEWFPENAEDSNHHTDRYNLMYPYVDDTVEESQLTEDQCNLARSRIELFGADLNQ